MFYENEIVELSAKGKNKKSNQKLVGMVGENVKYDSFWYYNKRSEKKFRERYLVEWKCGHCAHNIRKWMLPHELKQYKKTNSRV